MNTHEIYYKLQELINNTMEWHSGKLSDVDLLGELSVFVDIHSHELQCLIGSFEQIKWERDTAIAQLKELGYELGEKIEKDCKTCVNSTDDFNNDIDNGCYLCCKGLENNYKQIEKDC